MNANTEFELSIDEDPRFAKPVHGHMKDYTDTMKLRVINHIAKEFENSRPLTRAKTEFVGNHTYVTREIFVTPANVSFEAIEITSDENFFDQIVEDNVRKELLQQRDAHNKANRRHPERK